MAFTLSELKNKWRALWASHWLALSLACVVAVIGIAPHIWFALSLGSEYKGLYMTQAANELEYLGRVQEISEGHWGVGSVPFLEYKSNPPFMPPSALEILSAVASRASGVSIANIFIVSKALLPAILFLLIYWIVWRIGGAKPETKRWALAAAAFSVLGYDLVDYRSVLGFLRGGRGPDEFLIWTRPINPIFGGILVFLFVGVLWNIYSQISFGKWKWRIFGGVLLGLGILSYFFSWGAISALLGIMFLTSFFQRRWDVIKSIVWAGLIGAVVSAPYWYNLWKTSGTADYTDSAMRSGLFLTRAPILNKVTVATLLLFLLITWLDDRRQNLNHFRKRELWWYMAFGMACVGLVVFNQQVITGKTVWPYHFVQYVILICVSALAIFASRLEWAPKFLTRLIAGLIIIVSIAFGIYSQTMTYVQNVELYRGRQHYADLVSWLNANGVSECVVLAEDKSYVGRIIPAFTRCNVYISDFWSFLLPSDRLYFNYLVHLRLKGIAADNIDSYLKDEYSDAIIYFWGTQAMGKELRYGDYQLFLDKLADDYKDFLKKDFVSELERYRIDYLFIEQGKSFGMQELIKNKKPKYSSPLWNLYAI